MADPAEGNTGHAAPPPRRDNLPFWKKILPSLRKPDHVLALAAIVVSLLTAVFSLWFQSKSNTIAEQGQEVAKTSNAIASRSLDVSERSMQRSDALNTAMTRANQEMSVMNALAMISGQVVSLKGRAKLSDPNQATDDADNYAKGTADEIISKQPTLQWFEVNTVAANSLVALCSTLLEEKSAFRSLVTSEPSGTTAPPEQPEILLLRKYIGPLLYPKCRSENPAVAATALLAFERLLVKDVDLRARFMNSDDGGPKVADFFQRMNLVKVNFGPSRPNFSGFTFAEARFDQCRFEGAFDSPQKAAAQDPFLSASITACRFDGCNFEGVRQNGQEGKGQDASPPWFFFGAKGGHPAGADLASLQGLAMKWVAREASLELEVPVFVAASEPVSFKGAKFNSVCLCGTPEARGPVEMYGAKFDEAKFDGTTIGTTNPNAERAVLPRASFRAASFKDTRFVRCDLRGAVFERISVAGTLTFEDCLLDSAIIRVSAVGAPSPAAVRVKGGSARGAVVDSSDGLQVKFDSTDLSGADLRGVPGGAVLFGGDASTLWSGFTATKIDFARLPFPGDDLARALAAGVMFREGSVIVPATGCYVIVAASNARNKRHGKVEIKPRGPDSFWELVVSANSATDIALARQAGILGTGEKSDTAETVWGLRD